MKSKFLLMLCLIFVLFSIATVSASEDIKQINYESDDLSEDILAISIESDNDKVGMSENEVLTAGNNLYVNSSSDSSGNGSQLNPYNNFRSALTVSNDGDTIYLAGGKSYTGINNTALEITKKLNIVNWGNDEVIFDAEGLNPIFNIKADEINITGITFKNGYSAQSGGAIIFNYLKNSHINATFINNTAHNGGAISISSVDNSNFAGKFINNNALIQTISYTGGGAIFIENNVVNCNFTADFINNTVFIRGGAIIINGKASNSIFSGNYINNAAGDWGGAIYLAESCDNKIYSNFTNNKADSGGAIRIIDSSNTEINSNFTNNKAEYYGGAIYLGSFFVSTVNSNLNINGNFIRNNADEGAAIYVDGYTSNLKINSNFINNYNTLAYDLGIIYLMHDGENNLIYNSLFVNNTAKSIIEISNAKNTTIKDNIFLNNKKTYDISFKGSSGLNADNNWFGNNDTTYKTKPSIYGNVDYDTWLLLNATANPKTLVNLHEMSNITFKLLSYNKNSGVQSEYDNNLLEPVNLTVTSTNGMVNKEIIGLGDTVTFTLTGESTASVTASVENAQDTIKLNVLSDPGLSVSADSINYTENATFKLTYNNTATGKVNITLYRKESDRTYMYPDLDINETISFFDKNLIPGTYNVTVTYSGDDVFTNDTAYTTFTINKTKPLVELIAHDINVTDVESPLFTITLKKNCPIDTLIWNITPENSKHNKVHYSDENGNIVYDILNFHNPEGEYLLNIASLNKDYYYDFTEKATAHIFRLDPNLSFENQEMNYSKEIKIALNYNNTATGTVNIDLTGKKHNYAFSADINETISLSNILPDEYEVSVNYNGDLNFKNATAYGVLTVNKVEFAIKLVAFDINVTDINRTMFLVTVPYGYDRVVGWNQTPAKYEKSRINDTEVYYIDVRNGGNPAGEYFDYINCTGSDIYNDVFINVTSHILKLNPGLSAEDREIDYSKETTIALNYNNTATGKVNVTLTGKKFNYKFSDIEINETILLPESILPDEYEVSVAYLGDSNFNNATARAVLTVNKVEFAIKLVAFDINVTDINRTMFLVTVPYGYDRVVGWNQTPAKYNKYEIYDKDVYYIDVRNGGNPAGEYFDYINCTGSDIYKNKFINVTSHILKLNPGLSLEDREIDYGEEVKISLNYNNNATGKVNVTLTGKKFNYNFADIEINKTILLPESILPDEYEVSVAYSGDYNFTNAADDAILVVNKLDITPQITYDDATFNVSVPEDVTGNITLTIANKTLVVSVEKGTAVFDLSDIPGGNYNATVTYPGDDKYNGFEENVALTVGADKIIIMAEDLTKYYHGPERFTVIITTLKGILIANETVQITINGVSYYRTTDENGTVSLAINLHSGEFDVLVSVNDTNITAKVTVLPTVNGTDLLKVFRSKDQYAATFRYSNGTYLEKGSVVEFNVHGVIYKRTVDGNNGLAKLNINLEQGEYIITATNLVTGEMSSNNITVIPRIIENHDTVLYYRNGTQFTAKIIGDDFNVSGAGIEVKFNINGVFYTRLTDENGVVNLNINLGPGDYIITSEYMGCKVSNIIKVLPVLTADDISMKYGDGTQYKAKLVDGQGKALSNQKISTNINGRFYERNTDSNGMIYINLNSLPAGQYLPTSQYAVNGAYCTSKITISG